MAPRAVLVDLDGTVWNSYPWYARLLTATGNISESSALKELQAGQSIVSLLRRCGVPASTLERRRTDLSLFPGVAETLEVLGARGTPLGAVTSLPGRLVSPMLEGVALHLTFATVIHAGNCRFRKPHPGPVLAALRDLGIPPGPQVLYVGDMEGDAQAAATAGIEFAWAAYGYGGGRPASAVHVLRRFADILAL
jgi:HAD superfamily hydrolase (TIGR01549 family)